MKKRKTGASKSTAAPFWTKQAKVRRSLPCQRSRGFWGGPVPITNLAGTLTPMFGYKFDQEKFDSVKGSSNCWTVQHRKIKKELIWVNQCLYSIGCTHTVEWLQNIQWLNTTFCNWGNFLVHWLCKLLLIRRQEAGTLQSIVAANVSAWREEGRSTLNLSEELNTVKTDLYSGVTGEEWGGGKCPQLRGLSQVRKVTFLWD